MAVAVKKINVEDFLTSNGLKLSGIVSVERSSPKGVFDVTVKDETITLKHSFIANGIVTHNSSEPNYLENILMTQGVKVPVEEIFGIRNPQTSQWAIKPRVRYYSESIAEKFFDSVAKLQRFLPDKIKVGDDYFYVYNHTKDNIASFKGKYDKAFYQKSGKIRVPAQDSLPQALLIVDSYPAMLPEGQDVDDPGSAMAMQARMFSEQIKRIKGKMKSKRITVVGMNQLRDKPMVMYGSPVYEPCFVGSTPVLLADGNTDTISNIVLNKRQVKVLSFDPETGKVAPKNILDWKDNGYKELSDLITVSYYSQDATNCSFICTKDHKIWTQVGWKRAEDLILSDTLYLNTTQYDALQGTRIIEIISSVIGDNVYDLTVEDNHTYFVGGSSAVAVSNCGQAVKFYSDCRIQVSSRTNPHGKGQIDEEASYDGRGNDKYRYIHTKATKNKLSTPYLEGMMRVWTEDVDGKARGMDPVWDTWQYLLLTGQIDGKRNKFKIKFKEWADMKALTWTEFKTLILGTKKEHMALFERLGIKPINIRKFCQKQLAEGNGTELYFDHIKRGGTKVEEPESDDK